MKQKIYLIVTVLTLFSLKLLAQDIITLKDGTEITSKILEVAEDVVKYKKWDYQDGPTFTISKDKVFMIKYSNGTKDVFNDSSKPKEKEEDKPKENVYNRNMLSLNPLHLALGGNLSLAYEAYSKNGKTGFKIPLVFPVIANYYNNQLTIGLDIKHYPTSQGKVKYFIGPSVIVGTDNSDYLLLGLLFNNGVAFQLGTIFNITLDGAIGASPDMEYYSYRPENKIKILPVWRVGLSFGFRF